MQADPFEITTSKKEHPSTYFVKDQSSKIEMTRLQIQDHMLTAGMGGVLPEQPNPECFHRVLDVGCGTGGWLIATAKAYPHMSHLVGVDVNGRIIEYAREQARQAGCADHVEFQIMDALLMLEFPPHFFDLVNQRMNFSYLRKWDWPYLLQRYLRVVKPYGTIRITESTLGKTNSPALSRLIDLAITAFAQGGHLFEQDPESVPGALPGMMTQQGIRQVQTREIPFIYHHNTPEFQEYYDDTSLLFRTIIPFLNQWIKVPGDYDKTYKRALDEMQQPGFEASFKMVTAWGTAPS